MWDFLDKMDKNLLYRYMTLLSGKKGYLYATDKCNVSKEWQQEQRKQTACYLIWFTYRYILKCKTLQETVPYQNKETLKKFKLLSFFQNEAIFLCNDEICFRKVEDVSILLEIMYNKYDLWEQFDCFIRNTDGIRKKRCIEAKEKYQEIYKRICEGESFDGESI